VSWAVAGRDRTIGPIRVETCADPGHETKKHWDRLVDTTAGTDVTQMSSWARVRACAGYSPLYALAWHEDRLTAGAQVLYRRLPLLGKIGYIAYGPVIPPAAPQRDALVRALTEVLTDIGHNLLRMLFVQPPEGAEDVSRELLRRGFRPSTAQTVPAGSIRIDLTSDVEQIRACFAKRLRSWPSRWAARGVSVRQGDERDLPLLAALVAESGRRHNYRPPRLGYLHALYGELAATGHVAVFVGQVHGEPASVDLVTICCDTVRGRLGGFDRSGEAGRLSLPGAVRWEIIRWAKRHGYRWLDFGGLHAQVLDDMLDRGIRYSDAWPGSQRAKVSFGGVPFRYPQPIELISSPTLRAAYDLSRRWKGGQQLIANAQTLLRGIH
jgi:lipid II:glycine glycyltransferase (peptidoglycan interpeptide bridge formation enzyme)